jgi:hypothetical protein
MGGDRCDFAVAKNADKELRKRARRLGRPPGLAHRANPVVGGQLELPGVFPVLEAPGEAQPARAQDPIWRIDDRGREHALVHRLTEGLERGKAVWSVEKHVPFDSFVHRLWRLAKGECGVFFTS